MQEFVNYNNWLTSQELKKKALKEEIYGLIQKLYNIYLSEDIVWDGDNVSTLTELRAKVNEAHGHLGQGINLNNYGKMDTGMVSAVAKLADGTAKEIISYLTTLNAYLRTLDQYDLTGDYANSIRNQISQINTLVQTSMNWKNDSVNQKIQESVSRSRKYEYGCVMLYVEPIEFTWNSILSQVPKAAIHTEGLDTEPHITILFGLHYKEVKVEDVIKVVKTFKVPNKLYLSNPSYFEGQAYDVLKYDASNPALHEFNAKIKKFPYTNNFPLYRPHMTVGYLNKGFKVDIQPKILEVVPKAFVISGFNDDEKIKTYISL